MQSFAADPVAAGVRYGRYRLATAAGPLVVSVVAVDPAVPGVRLDTALAGDTLTSHGESVPAMAARAGAIAGINGDFFDIGGSGEPLGVYASGGALVRSPGPRAAVAAGPGGFVFGPLPFSGTADVPGGSLPIDRVDRWPPSDAAATLVLPAFGRIPPAEGVRLVELTPAASGTYTVGEIADDGAGHAAMTALAISAPFAALQPLPNPGDPVRVRTALGGISGPLSWALGGGPLYWSGGAPNDDPDPPAPGEARFREPLSAFVRRADGTLLLVEVDGHDPERSVGLTRAEFGALLGALGAQDAIGLDGGGSSTLVARVGVDPAPTLVTMPSDGRPRPVADGLFAFAGPSNGRPAALATDPDRLDLLVGAPARVEALPIDAGGHATAAAAVAADITVSPAGIASVRPDGTIVGRAPGRGRVTVRHAGLIATIPIAVDERPASVRIEPESANPEPGGVVRFRLVAFDGAGDPLELPPGTVWSASSGSIEPDGRFTAGERDAEIGAHLGALRATTTALVGRRTVPVPMFAAAAAERWHFASYPAGNPGKIALDGDALTLAYDFRERERAAYARTELPLGGVPLALSLAVDGNADGVGLRAAFADRFGRVVRVTLAKSVDWTGPRRLFVRLPAPLAAPVTLRDIYAVASLDGHRHAVAGSVVVRDARITFAGSAGPALPLASP